MEMQQTHNRGKHMKSTITEIIHDMVLNGPVPAKTIAREIDKPYTTMLRELNPYDNGAKVGVDMLVPLMKAAKSVAPLNHLAQEMGFAIMPVVEDAAPAGEPLQLALRLLQQLGELSGALEPLQGNGLLSEEHLTQAERCGHDILATAMDLRETLRKLQQRMEPAPCRAA